MFPATLFLSYTVSNDFSILYVVSLYVFHITLGQRSLYLVLSTSWYGMVGDFFLGLRARAFKVDARGLV